MIVRMVSVAVVLVTSGACGPTSYFADGGDMAGPDAGALSDGGVRRGSLSFVTREVSFGFTLNGVSFVRNSGQVEAIVGCGSREIGMVRRQSNGNWTLQALVRDAGAELGVGCAAAKTTDGVIVAAATGKALLRADGQGQWLAQSTPTDRVLSIEELSPGRFAWIDGQNVVVSRQVSDANTGVVEDYRIAVSSVFSIRRLFVNRFSFGLFTSADPRVGASLELIDFNARVSKRVNFSLDAQAAVPASQVTDLDGDGNLEWVQTVIPDTRGRLRVVQITPIETTRLELPLSLGLGQFGYTPFAADYDGDGDVDISVETYQQNYDQASGRTRVYLNSGQGQLETNIALDRAFSPVEVLDVNGDDVPDIIGLYGSTTLLVAEQRPK